MIDDRTFTDEQLTSACDLHIDNLRQLITWKAVIPYQRGGGRGRVRLWTMTHVHRVSLTAAIFNSGFSLRMAHTLAYLMPLDDLLSIYDPLTLAMNRGDTEGWFDPEKPRVEPLPSDWLIHIVNGRYVYCELGDADRDEGPWVYGELNRDHTLFRCAIDFAHMYGTSTDPNRPGGEHGKWVHPFAPEAPPEIDPASLAWEYYPDLDESLAKDLLKRPKSKHTINMTLGLRVAVRRVLGIPADYP